MRNSILVKNTAYYTSSLTERKSLVAVKDFSNTDFSEWKGDTFDSTFVRNEHLQEYRTDAHFAIVFNNIKDEVFTLDSNASTNINVTDRVDKIEYGYPLIFIEVASNMNYQIVVLNKEDSYYDSSSCCIVVENRISEMNPVFDSYGDIITTLIKGMEYLVDGIGRPSLTYIDNKYKEKNIYEDVEIDNIDVYVKPREATEYLIRDDFAIVISTPSKEDGFESMPALEINVANIINGGTDTGTSSGGDLKQLIFTIQQMSFFEFKMKFEKKEVSDVFNLPKGLFFDKDGQRIIGTPMLSGKYSITVIFNDSSILGGTIDVPKLNREL